MNTNELTLAHAGALDRIEDQLRLGVADLQRVTLTLAALALAVASGDPDRLALATEQLERLVDSSAAEAERLGRELEQLGRVKGSPAWARARALGLGGLPDVAIVASASALAQALALARLLRGSPGSPAGTE